MNPSIRRSNVRLAETASASSFWSESACMPLARKADSSRLRRAHRSRRPASARAGGPSARRGRRTPPRASPATSRCRPSCSGDAVGEHADDGQAHAPCRSADRARRPGSARTSGPRGRSPSARTSAAGRSCSSACAARRGSRPPRGRDARRSAVHTADGGAVARRHRREAVGRVREERAVGSVHEVRLRLRARPDLARLDGQHRLVGDERTSPARMPGRPRERRFAVADRARRRGGRADVEAAAERLDVVDAAHERAR